MESREERISRVRVRYPNAFSSWLPEDDAALREAFDAFVREQSARFGRPAGGVRMRLDHLRGGRSE